MHLRSRNLPRPSASSPLDNRAPPMANASQVPDLEGLHHEIHGMAEQMRVMNENNARLIQLLAAANPQPPAAPSVPDVERSRHSNRSGGHFYGSTERARGRCCAPSPSIRERISSSESSQTRSRVRRGRSPRRGDHTEARDKSTSQKIRDLDARLDAINTGTNAPVTVDTLVRQTDPPFTERVLGARISSKFKLPTQLGIYEGKTDPMDHLDSYKSLMSLKGYSDEIMCKAFSATLKGPARSWFRKLSPGTIDSFGELSRLFVANFMSCKNRQKNASHLFTVHQKETESLKDFVKRFNQAILEVEDPSDKSTSISPQKSWPKPNEGRRGKDDHKRKELDTRRADYREETRYKRPNRDPKRSNDRRPRTPPRRPEFILPPLNAPVAQVLSEIKHEEFVKWPRKIKTDPQKRNKNKYCEFHRDHGHNTEDCFQLKEQIADLIKRGYLRKYITDRPPPNSPERRYGDNRPTARNIQTIHGGFGSGGCSTSSRKKHARSAFRSVEEEVYNLSSPCVGDQPPITFSSDDLRGLHLPHDDALVVSAVIANFNVQRILIDSGNSADILFISVFEKMKIGLDKLHPFHNPLIGFGGNTTQPLGWVNLPITLGTEPHQTTVWQDFIVVDCPSPYNAILGRPTLGGIKAITSTYHLKMKFPTLTGIGEKAGDDAGILRSEMEQLILEDPRETENTKPLEEVVPISIHPNYPDRQVMIGTELTDELRIALIDFLKKNSDVFAWSQGDVPGIDLEVAMHKLFTKPESIPLEFLAIPSIGIANQVLQAEKSPTWMDEIIAYLQDGILPKEKLQARRLQYRSARFYIFNGKLYKRSFSGPLLKCLRPEEAEFGIPKVIISDNARQFDNDRFRLFCSDLAISHHFSSPGHPQANGQVEVTNRTILRNLKARLERSKIEWAEDLPSILWAYHTTSRIPTGETPYSMVFGTESVIPVEIGMPSFRTLNFDKNGNEGVLRLNLDLLDEKRESAELRQAAYKNRIAKYYNERVKHRSFLPGDLVLRRVTLSTRDPSAGKLGPTWEGPYKVIKVSRPGTYWLEDLNEKALLHPWNAEHLKKNTINKRAISP
ncbi:hypothetical protein Acr_20g0005850 [Actinidia rufa]|uniref:Integrase catalytic domain-containing protein n=1 Tax=Actinidia rufa TaxID=165716 RepID=A0A7J0GD95_9ERIC|nr:hypothetical protein Acr_20g0005850 [Actinidia rufa]